MKACHTIHHAVVYIASFVMKIHRFEKIVVGLKSKYIKLCTAARIFVNYKVASLRVNSFLVWIVGFLVNLYGKEML